MRKISSIIFFLILTSAYGYSQELFVRNDKYFTEVYLKVDTASIASVERKGDNVVILFLKNLKKPFSTKLDDPFVSAISAEGNKFTISMKPGSEFTIVNDTTGVKVVATRKKSNSDILSSYGIGKPLLSKDSTVAEDAEQEDALNNADKLISAKQFSEGAAVLNKILATSKNDFYRQEALYRLGQTYLLMAQYNDEYLLNAYQTFDDFVKLYPDNFRAADALMKSAEAKELANQLFEAIFTYQKIYDSVPDLESKRTALTKMAELYSTVGQMDKAVAMYKTYLRQFRSEADKINANIGLLYYDQKEMDMAYEYFSTLSIDNLLNDPSNDVRRLFSIAKNFEQKKRYNDALKIYTFIYEKFPDSAQSNDAIFNSADILQKTGRSAEADKLLLRLKELFPDRLSGQQATIEYAKKYLQTKPYAYWNEFFADLLSKPDLFGLHKDAKYMLLKTMYREGDIDGTINGVSAFLADYSTSEYAKELDKMRENFLFTKASNAFAAKDMLSAEEFLLQFSSEYPKSVYMNRVKDMLLDIKFGKTEKLFKDTQYRETMRQVENHIAENPESAELERWFNLLDDATYRNIVIIYSSDDFPAARVSSRQYLANFPYGKYRKQVSDMLEQSVSKPMNTLYKSGSLQELIRLYEANQDWIKSWKNKQFKDEMLTLTGLAVYKMGSPSKARMLYAEITPNKSTNYAILGLVLGDKNMNIDINSFDNATFKYVIGEVEQFDSDMAISLLKSYTKDMKLSTSLQYGIAKNIPSDTKREEILRDIYNTITQNQSSRFDGSDEVHLDMGLLSYRKNDFKGAVIPLKAYVDAHKTNDEKRAEALYYLGKSFVGMDDRERGYQYYNEIIQTMPDSIYAGIAKSELDEDSWKKNLNRF